MVDTMYIYIKIIDSYNLQHQQFTLNAIKFLLSNRFAVYDRIIEFS